MKPIYLSLFISAFAATGMAQTDNDPIADPKAPAVVPAADTHTGLWDSHRVDSHAPIGVMGDHTHDAGEFMFSYRYMYMSMDGQRDGTDELSSGDLFRSGYMVAPTGMDMEMHMVGAMFAPSDYLTLMAMTNYQYLTMDHLSRPGSPARMMRGETYSENVEGWGDLTISSLLKLYDANRQRIHLNVGVSAPTGEFTPRAYPMQPTTGTWDFLPGITWLWQGGNLSGGSQVNGRIHLDDNEYGYSYGDSVDGTTWLAYRLTDWASVSSRLTLTWEDDIDGEDFRFRGQRMSPPMDPANFGGTELDFGLGVNLLAPSGFLKGHRLAIEGVLPVYQDLNGPQMPQEWSFVVGWQKAF